MKEAKGGVFSQKDFQLIKKMIINTLNPSETENFTNSEKTELKALYHRLGRFND